MPDGAQRRRASVSRKWRGPCRAGGAPPANDPALGGPRSTLRLGDDRSVVWPPSGRDPRSVWVPQHGPLVQSAAQMGHDLLRDAAGEHRNAARPAPRTIPRTVATPGPSPACHEAAVDGLAGDRARPARTETTSTSRPQALAWRCALIVVVSATSSSACFIEIARPPQFRYACASDEDCPDGESCVSALCQVPCTTATAAEACPSEAGYIGCFNGGCASLCNVGDDVCPGPQTCIGASDGSGGDAGDEGSAVGLCGAPCSADEPSSCPEGETCAMGACVLPCVEADPDPCPDGLVCALGVCVSDQLPFSGSLPAQDAFRRASEAAR